MSGPQLLSSASLSDVETAVLISAAQDRGSRAASVISISVHGNTDSNGNDGDHTIEGTGTADPSRPVSSLRPLRRTFTGTSRAPSEAMSSATRSPPLREVVKYLMQRVEAIDQNPPP